MNDRAAAPVEQASNQPPLLVGYNAWEQDAIWYSSGVRQPAAPDHERAHKLGELVGSEKTAACRIAAQPVHRRNCAPHIALASASTPSTIILRITN